MYQPRKFVQEDYDKFDSSAKSIMIDHLLLKGYEIVRSDEDYHHDIVASKDGSKFYFELEVKVGRPFTSVDDFPFDTVSFTGRKIRLHRIKPFFYVIFSLETNSYLYCHSSVIYDEKYAVNVNIDSKNRKGLDIMYRIPKHFCKFVSI